MVRSNLSNLFGLVLVAMFILWCVSLERSLEQSLERIGTSSLINDFGGVPLQVVVDRWRGSFRTESLTNVLKDVIARSNTSLSILGPSTAEINKAIDGDLKNVLEKCFKYLAGNFIRLIL